MYFQRMNPGRYINFINPGVRCVCAWHVCHSENSPIVHVLVGIEIFLIGLIMNDTAGTTHIRLSTTQCLGPNQPYTLSLAHCFHFHFSTSKCWRATGRMIIVLAARCLVKSLAFSRGQESDFHAQKNHRLHNLTKVV